jgi:FMN phosphatase YigB (HAD superfamily)/DNA-binding XRE family transcriptional regulator
MNEEELGRALQAARKNAGLTQQQLCQKADLSYSTLAKIERGAIKAPSIFTIHSIAEALGLTLNELLGEIIPDKPKKKQSATGIKFVYFDINGCLVHFYHRAFTILADDTGKPADMIETTFWHYNDAVCRGEMSMDDFNAVLGEQLEKPGIDWRNYYLEAVEPIQEMYELVHWAQEHYHIGLLSNIMPDLIPMMLKKEILPNVEYDSIIDSSEVKAIKPEEEIFVTAAEKVPFPPEELLLIDDSRANVMAAERLGWRVLWFDAYRPVESVRRVRDALRFE